jgi:hypothetical protein
MLAVDSQRLGTEPNERIDGYAVGTRLGDLPAGPRRTAAARPPGDRDGQLTVDCLAGGWTNDLLPETRPAEHPAVTR